MNGGGDAVRVFVDLVYERVVGLEPVPAVYCGEDRGCGRPMEMVRIELYKQEALTA